MLLDDFLFMSNARPPHCTYSRGLSDYGAVALELIAPEVADYSGAISPKADVWAFGCCLYRWITGVLPPISGDSQAQILRQAIPMRFQGPIYHAIDLALQPHPAARATAEDLVRVLGGSVGRY